MTADEIDVNTGNQFIDSLHRFELLSIATKEGIWEYDFETKKSFYNKGMTDLFGYSEEEMEDNNSWWRNNLHPADKKNIQLLDELLAGDKTVWWGQYRFLCRNGEYKKVLDRLFVVRDNDNKALRLIGTMQDLTELDKLQAQVENLKSEHRKSMAKAIIHSEETERKNISEELNENINQVLAAVNMIIGNPHNFKKQTGKPWLAEVKELLSYSMKGISNIANRLSPPVLNSLGLESALEDLLTTLNKERKVNYSIIVDEDAVKHKDEDIRILLYRIAQSQVINIGKHSDAENVLIEVIPQGTKLRMIIHDDGAGINLAKLRFGQGFYNIQERVEAFGGIFKLESKAGEPGFLLSITI
jgi:PAS domain S-box-containing protein